MNARILTTLLGIAVFAIPAAVPASQPADIRLNSLSPQVAVVPAPAQFALLLADPHRPTQELAIVLPAGHDTFDWIDQDPFAL